MSSHNFNPTGWGTQIEKALKNTCTAIRRSVFDSEISMNQQKYFNFSVDDIDRCQAENKLMPQQEKLVAGLANEAEKKIYSLYNEADATITENYVTSGNVLRVLSMAIKALYKNNVSTGMQLSLEVSPGFAERLLRAGLLSNRPNEGLMNSGYMGQLTIWPNVKVYYSSNLPQEKGKDVIFLRTKNAIAYGGNLQVETYRPQNSFEDAIKGLYTFDAQVVKCEELAVILCGYGEEGDIS